MCFEMLIIDQQSNQMIKPFGMYLNLPTLVKFCKRGIKKLLKKDFQEAAFFRFTTPEQECKKFLKSLPPFIDERECSTASTTLQFRWSKIESHRLSIIVLISIVDMKWILNKKNSIYKNIK